MITMQEVLTKALTKPINEWSLMESLAYEIFQTDNEIRRLRKQLKQAEEHSLRVKRQWYECVGGK